MTFRQNIARLITGDISLHSIPAIAIGALEEGLDTPSLRILAGLSDTEYSFTIDKYLKETIKELSLILPNKRQAAIELGLAIVDEIFEGKRSVFDGVQQIKWKAIDSYPFYEETKHYCYDSIGFEKAYGIFVTIDDLRSAANPWQADKTNLQLEQELSLELLTELKQWSSRLKNGS